MKYLILIMFTFFAAGKSSFFLTDSVLAQNNMEKTHDEQEATCSFNYDSLLMTEVYYFADKKAEFPGGDIEMQKFIYKNLLAPAGKEVYGSVFVQLIIDEEGKIIRKVIKRSLGKEADQEVMTLIDKMPLWEPAMCDGKTVCFAKIIPFKFK